MKNDIAEKIVCPKCLVEGLESQLSEPEKTEEGWVQRCEKGHKLYIWCHVRVEDNLMIDLLDKKAYALAAVDNN